MQIFKIKGTCFDVLFFLVFLKREFVTVILTTVYLFIWYENTLGTILIGYYFCNF